MQRLLRKFAVFVAVGLSLGAAAAVQAQGTVPVSVVVTALGPKYTPPPALSQDDINVFESKDKSFGGAATCRADRKAAAQAELALPAPGGPASACLAVAPREFLAQHFPSHSSVRIPL